MHLREIFYGTLIFQQSSIIYIGRHVGGHTLALQPGLPAHLKGVGANSSEISLSRKLRYTYGDLAKTRSPDSVRGVVIRCHIAGILLTCSRLYNGKCVEIVKTNERNLRGEGRGVGEREGTTPSLDQARLIFAWPVF